MRNNSCLEANISSITYALVKIFESYDKSELPFGTVDDIDYTTYFEIKQNIRDIYSHPQKNKALIKILHDISYLYGMN